MRIKREFKKIDKDAGLKLIIEENCDGYCVVENEEKTYYTLDDRDYIIEKYRKRKVGWTYFQYNDGKEYYVFDMEGKRK